MKQYKELRVAFIAGTLGLGGAEKQLLYMAKALSQKGAIVRVYSLTKGDFYEAELEAQGVNVEQIDYPGNPIFRLWVLAKAFKEFHPHIVQAAHFYVNLYAALLPPLFGAYGIGSIRSDIYHELEGNPFWGRLLLQGPRTIFANSHRALQNAELLGLKHNKIFVLPNVIDVAAFDAFADGFEKRSWDSSREIIVVAVGRLISAKRYDRFISALALARQRDKRLKGIIIGDGPERVSLETFSRKSGLSERDLLFMGQSTDIPVLLREADIFVQTSDHEGFPNILLEAMAARLPVITTPAGDSDQIVIHNETGYVVPFNDIDRLADYIERLAKSSIMLEKMGNAGRARVEQEYNFSDLASKLMSLYSQIAAHDPFQRLIDTLPL
jgi:glycosyltransferase involved in cell wall biosynthesis